MRVVLDTNVVMWAIFFGGVPELILDAWKRGEVTVVLSSTIFEEYLRVGEELARQHGELEITPVLSLLAAGSEIVEAPGREEPVSRDPEDDKFLACARAVQLQIVVSRDDDLRSLGEWEGISILSPRQFVDAHLSEGT